MGATNNSENVSTGAPKVGGYAFRAPLGSALPTDAVTALDKAFNNLGYISEDGVVNANSPSSSDTKDWGGTVVNSQQDSKEDTFKFKLIESLNDEVLKTVYGDGNVSGDINTGIVIKANNAELEYKCYVFEMVMKGGIKKRVVLPCAKVTAVGEVTYKKADIIGYEVTVTCVADAAGNTHYDYMKKEA